MMRCSTPTAASDPPIDWFALSPLLVLLGGAMVLLVVGALTPPWPKRLYALFTAAAGAGGDDAVLLPVGRHHRRRAHARSSAARCLRQVRDVRHDHDLPHRCAGSLRHRRLPPARRPRRTRGLRALPAGRDRRHRDGVGQRPHRAVPRPRDPVDRAVRAGRQPPPAHREPESGIKYFVLGGFSSAFFLYGIALVYGGTGSTNFTRDRRLVQRLRSRPFATTRSCSPASRCCSSASAFKVAAVPFHFWAPDVYQGAPDAGHVVHGVGRQGRGVRRDAARAALVRCRTGSDD